MGNKRSRLRAFDVFIKELDGALHGEAEALRQIVIVALVDVQLDGLVRILHRLIQIFGRGQRHAVIVSAVMQLNRPGDIAHKCR